MSYSFRLRFNMHDTIRLKINLKNVELYKKDSTTVTLACTNQAKTIAEAEFLTLKGRGYESNHEAMSEAVHWMNSLQFTLAKAYSHADFGDRAFNGVLAEAGQKYFEKLWKKKRVLSDDHGIMVFESSPKPVFVKNSNTLVKDYVPDIFIRRALFGYQSKIELSEKERTAFNLYGLSIFQPLPDARLALLIMAIETLVERPHRSSESVDLINEFIRLANNSGLQDSQSISSALKDLKKVSIKNACKQLVSSLPDQYMGTSASSFLSDCYDIRSQLTHGATPRIPLEDVNKHVGDLDRMVSDLLTMSIGDVENA